MVGLAVWALAFPRPYLVCLAALALLPVAVLPVFNRLGADTGAQARPAWMASLAGLAGVAGVLLALRAGMDFRLLDWKLSLALGALLGAALAAAVAPQLLTLPARLVMLALALAAALAWGWGLGVAANGLFDRAPPVIHAAKVLGRRVSRGSRSKSYFLDIAPTNIAGLGDSVSVGFSLYRRVGVGDEVCIDEHAGALHWRWFKIRTCRPDPAALTFAPLHAPFRAS
jgi:hypothetical protein